MRSWSIRDEARIKTADGMPAVPAHSLAFLVKFQRIPHSGHITIIRKKVFILMMIYAIMFSVTAGGTRGRAPVAQWIEHRPPEPGA